MKYLNPMLMCDFYKVAHKNMYPKGTEFIYSTWTPRTSRIVGIDKVVVFGIQKFIKKYLIDFFNDNFFNQDIEVIKKDYIRTMKFDLGVETVDTKHIEDLHSLGYLPLEVNAIDEGISVPIRIPMMTIENTDSRFFWLTNYIETLASCELWQASTSATIAKQYRKILDEYANETSDALDFVQFQGHDFSFRGMSSIDSAINSGMGHLLSFVGTDTIPAIYALEHYYNADIEKGMVGVSVPASEHSVQCSYVDDYEYIKRLITEIHPTGIVSIVCDGYDFWKVLTEIAPKLKKEIMARDGKVVFRPDSGDPVKIICGDTESKIYHERDGAIEVLYTEFGGTINSKGYIDLDPHVGLIYGDSITLDRCENICIGLKNKGFSSTNLVYGIGSYTYQYNTRDTFGFALKSTSATINGVEKAIFKDPKTDDGTKKSQKGRVSVWYDGDGEITYTDNLTKETCVPYLLNQVFYNGELKKDLTLDEIKENMK